MVVEGKSEGSTINFERRVAQRGGNRPTHCGADAFVERNLNRHQRIIGFRSGLRCGCSDPRCAGQVGNAVDVELV